MTGRIHPRAMLIFLSEEEDGVRVTLDDVVMDGADSTNWRRDCLYTYKTYGHGEIESLAKGSEKTKIPEQEFAEFGHDIFARLSAFLVTRKPR